MAGTRLWILFRWQLYPPRLSDRHQVKFEVSWLAVQGATWDAPSVLPETDSRSA